MADHLQTLLNHTPDMVVGGVGLVIFLVFAYAVGRVVGAVKNARFAQVWAPLIPIISGTILYDDGGTSSRLTGTYQGRKVEADMTPGASRSSVGEDIRRCNEFEIWVMGVSGGQDWHVSLQRPLLGLGKAEWTINADEALREKLDSLGVITTIERMGGMSLRYTAQQSKMEYHTDVTPRWAPTPERFREDLESLRHLADAAEKINPA